MTRAPCSDQLLEKDVDADGGRVVIGEIARLVRTVYPNLRSTTTLQTAYKASETNSDGSMDLKQFESMLKNLVLFNNEARTFDGAYAMLSQRCRRKTKPPTGDRLIHSYQPLPQLALWARRASRYSRLAGALP